MEDLVRHKRTMDSAIIMMGVATRVEDLNAAYCTAVLNYEWLRRREAEGAIELTLSESAFMKNLNHIANYNIVRVASRSFNMALDGEMDKDKCMCQLSQCIVTLKDHDDMHIEKMLLEDMLNTIS